MSLGKFTAAITIGRGARHLAEAMLAVRCGDRLRPCERPDRGGVGPGAGGRRGLRGLEPPAAGAVVTRRITSMCPVA